MKKYTKPGKAPGALLNTWLVDIDDGSTIIGKIIRNNRTISVYFTSDRWETISIADESMNIRIQVPFKKIEELINTARKVRNN